MKFRGCFRRCWNGCAALAASILWGGAGQAALPQFDFTQESGRAGWIAAHDISGLSGGPDGLTLQISGADPYLTGPSRDYPAGQPLWLRLRMRSEQGGSCQVFYYTNNPTETNSVRFSVPAGFWVEGRVPLPGLGSAYRMRIDTPGVGGKATLASLAFEERRPLPDFDFSTVPDVTQWTAAHDITSLQPGLEGLRINIGGGDPYLFGPARDYPTNALLWLNIRLFAEQTGICQVFYFTDGPTEEKSVRFSVPAGVWHQNRVPLPALGRGYRLRIDPPGSGGHCVLGRLWFDERVLYPPPQWPKPQPPELGSRSYVLESGPLKLTHGPTGQGAFALEVQGQRVAIGNSSALVGYVVTNAVRWFRVDSPGGPDPEISATTSNLIVKSKTRDPEGAEWHFQNSYTVSRAGQIQVEGSVTVDQEREVLYLPAFTLLPGVGSWGTNKNQALFAGIEYLENEPSSSEADVEGPAAWRLVPNTVKSTIPLIAFQANGRYIGFAWEPQPQLSAVFDSPDRQFGSGGHLAGLIFPGSNGENREERSLLPYDAMLVKAGATLQARSTILGGLGDTVVPAVQQYAANQSFPAPPSLGTTTEAYLELAARGWLDSRIQETNRYRHAYWPGFSPQPASDAAVWMSWLAGVTGDAQLAARLTNAAAKAIAQVNPAGLNASQIGHIRYPLPALVFGSVLENAAQAESDARSIQTRFQPDGTVTYQPKAGGLDYGRTYWASHANGLTASVTLSLLEAAAFSGDPDALAAALKQVRSLSQYSNSVPRGAQTWEIPLHTPDILASAYLVRLYQLAYELFGDPDFINQARYWAWTGVPFIYLRSPVSGPIGLYSTIPVLGATAWTAPVWIGLPVQWCGLVYAEALYRFAPYDPAGPWLSIANGITASGIQQSWPTSDAERQGLLPDVFHLESQLRDGPAINPATVLIPALRMLGLPVPYSFRALLHHGLRVHAPGDISDVAEKSDSVTFRVRAWASAPFFILVNGAKQQPKLKIDGHDVAPGYPHQYLASEGRFVIRLERSATVTLVYPATHALRISPGKGQAQVSWPQAASNSVLESTADLGPSATWTTSTLPRTLNAGEWTAAVPLGSPQGHFRLRLVAE